MSLTPTPTPSSIGTPREEVRLIMMIRKGWLRLIMMIRKGWVHLMIMIRKGR